MLWPALRPWVLPLTVWALLAGAVVLAALSDSVAPTGATITGPGGEVALPGSRGESLGLVRPVGPVPAGHLGYVSVLAARGTSAWRSQRRAAEEPG